MKAISKQLASNMKRSTPRERGYKTREEVALALEEAALRVRAFPPNTLVKVSIQLWLAEDNDDSYELRNET